MLTLVMHHGYVFPTRALAPRTRARGVGFRHRRRSVSVVPAEVVRFLRLAPRRRAVTREFSPRSVENCPRKSASSELIGLIFPSAVKRRRMRVIKRIKHRCCVCEKRFVHSRRYAKSSMFPDSNPRSVSVSVRVYANCTFRTLDERTIRTTWNGRNGDGNNCGEKSAEKRCS